MKMDIIKVVQQNLKTKLNKKIHPLHNILPGVGIQYES